MKIAKGRRILTIARLILMKFVPGTEVCIDVNDYQEGVNDGSARIGDVSQWEREGCFNKKAGLEFGQGNISWYNNNVTFINGERVSESRINDSGGRYWAKLTRLRITDSALWGLWKTGTTDEWILPPNDWNVFGGDGGGEWWGGGGGGGGWGPLPLLPPPRLTCASTAWIPSAPLWNSPLPSPSLGLPPTPIPAPLPATGAAAKPPAAPRAFSDIPKELILTL